jgi:hypothetical protein
MGSNKIKNPLEGKKITITNPAKAKKTGGNLYKAARRKLRYDMFRK